MQRKYIFTLILLFFSATLYAVSVSAHQGPHFDVSYLWSVSLKGTEAYKKKVERVLGRKVSRSLKIVRGPRYYGLIYDCNAAPGKAKAIARAHSRLLRRHGLERATPLQDNGWKLVKRTTAVKKGATAPPKLAAAAPTIIHSTSTLEAAIEDYIKKQRRRGRIYRDEKTAWVVYDFTSEKKLVSINEDIPMQAASMIKPFIALAFFHKVREGKLRYGPKSKRMMRRMIQVSSNHATNWFMRRLGGPAKVQALLKTHYGSILQDVRLTEYIPRGGRTYRNKASAHDYSRFLYALWKDKLPGSKEMRRVMSLPSNNRLYSGDSDIPPDAEIYNKTGSTARLCGDMGILVVKGPDGKDYPYAVIGMIQKSRRASNYTRWLRNRGDVIREVSNIVYNRIVAQRKGKAELAAALKPSLTSRAALITIRP